MSTNPTPGPWYKSSTGNHQGLIISEATGANIAVTYDVKDADLIAAAPDLLESIAEFSGVWERGETFAAMDADEIDAMRQRARVAINKAKGL